MGVDPFASKLFATPQQTSERLDGGGFTEIECWLHPEPMPFRTVDELATYLETVVLGDHVEHLAPDTAQAFALEVAERMPRLEIDYVRLNIRARRAS